MMLSNRPLLTAVSWDLIYLVPSAALIWSLASAPATALARTLAAPALVYGGTISNALYLFHASVIDYINVDTTSVGGWTRSVRVVVSTALLIAAGAHHAIEVPGHRWLRGKLEQSLPAPASAGSDRSESH